MGKTLQILNSVILVMMILSCRYIAIRFHGGQGSGSIHISLESIFHADSKKPKTSAKSLIFLEIEPLTLAGDGIV